MEHFRDDDAPIRIRALSILLSVGHSVVMLSAVPEEYYSVCTEGVPKELRLKVAPLSDAVSTFAGVHAWCTVFKTWQKNSTLHASMPSSRVTDPASRECRCGIASNYCQ